jgi:1-acyl-sn-glycerol-3-phosphate acyltransferase
MLLQILRGTRLVIHLLVGLLLALAVALDRKRWLKPEALMSWWCQITLGIFNVQLNVRGAPLSSGRMTVANHVSWLDIIIIGACEPTRFVAKSEIQHWPVAGWLGNAAQTFYIRRGKGGARPLLDKLTPHLAGGGTVTIFPEGTTTDGRQVLPFHPRLFAAAVDAQMPVQPLALRYGASISGADIAPFIGDDDLVRHVLSLLKEPKLIAELHYCAPVRTVGLSREQVAAAAQQRIEAVVLPQPLVEVETDLETALV